MTYYGRSYDERWGGQRGNAAAAGVGGIHPGEPPPRGLERLRGPEDPWTGNEAAVVEVLRRYSNLPDLLKRVQTVLRQIETNDRTDEPGVRSTGRGGGLVPIRERLAEADLDEMVAGFQRGTTIPVLASQYDVCESSVKRALRERGVSRRNRGL
jgi:hypothetical protein